MEMMGLWEDELFSTFSFKMVSASQLVKKREYRAPEAIKNSPKKTATV